MDPGFLTAALQKREAENALRKLSVRLPGSIDFSSNDYLGFARLSALWEPETLPNYGSTGSRLLTGNSLIAAEAEAMIATFHHAETGLIYNSGYDANTGLFSCIAAKGDTIIYDEYSHTSIKDGARLSLARHYSFRHNDLDHLDAKIKRVEGNVFVAVESVYSMDGDLADLNGLVSLADKYRNVYLIVDEAHSTGVFGEMGQGLVQSLGLEDKFFARVHTFGKALGCQGAVILGSKTLRGYLINFSRPFIYTTALPLPNILAITRAYALLQNKNESLKILRDRIAYFQQKASNYPTLGIKTNESAIQVILIQGNEKIKAIAAQLSEDTSKTLTNSYDVRPVLNPTVPKGSERLRICLHAYNTEQEIDGLFEKLGNILMHSI